MTQTNPLPPSDDGAQDAPRPSDPDACQSWAAGHRVHWVQAQRARRSTEPGEYVPCEVIAATDDGWFTVVITATGAVVEVWNHDPERVRQLVGMKGLEINEHWSILCRSYAGGWDTFVSVRSTTCPCVVEPPTIPSTDDLADALFDQLQTHGGFSISGPEALRILAEQQDRKDREAP